jgi:hypothetical protein
MYPMMEFAKSDESGEQRIDLLSQYLAKLKTGGAMYIERDCISALLGDSKTLQMAMNRDPDAQQRLRDLTQDNAWMQRLEETLREKGIDVKISLLRQSLGFSGLSFAGVLQATNRVTQTSDLVVFLRK